MAQILVFPIRRHKQLEALARWIVEEHPYEQRMAAIGRETMEFVERQRRRGFPGSVAHEQWNDMGLGLAHHVGRIENTESFKAETAQKAPR